MTAVATLLLPPRARFGAQRVSEPTAKAFGRADRVDVTGTQRSRVLDILPRGWPLAAVTRQRDAGDAMNAAWLRADPAHIRAELNGARLMAYGDALQLTQDDVDAFLPALKPLFGDSGALIDAPVPSRWYLRLPPGAKLPRFSSPDEALGADLFDQLPGVAGDDPLGRRWRALLSDAQVALHNHPHNAERVRRGLTPVNSLWFWAPGVLPDHVMTDHAHFSSDDDGLRAFVAMTKATHGPLAPRWSQIDGAHVIDLRHAIDIARVDAEWIAPALADVLSGALDRLVLDFDDGGRFVFLRRQRWRFWRRPLTHVGLGAAAPLDAA